MKNCVIISMHAEKAFDKIQYLFLIQTLSNLGQEENLFSLIRGVQKRLTQQASVAQTLHILKKGLFP